MYCFSLRTERAHRNQPDPRTRAPQLYAPLGVLSAVVAHRGPLTAPQLAQVAAAADRVCCLTVEPITECTTDECIHIFTMEDSGNEAVP